MTPSFNNEAVRLRESIEIYTLLYASQMLQRFSGINHKDETYLYDVLSEIYCDIAL